jgi:membrane protein
MKAERLRAQLENLYGRLDRRLGGVPSLLVRTALAFDQDDGPLVARSIAYYTLFAVFPAILALIVVASTVLNTAEVQEAVMGLVSEYMPMAYDLVAANIQNLLSARETVSLVALIGLIWSASGVFSAIFRAVNRAWGIPKSKLALWHRVWGLVVILVVGAFFLLSLFIGPAVSLIRAWQGSVLGWQPLARPGTDRLVGWLSALAPVLFSVCAFILLYRTTPRARVTWGDVWLGGLIAGLIWEAGKQIFAWYVSNIATYSVIYGSVGAIIAFMLWSYLSGQLLLLGAEFTVVYSRWRRAGRPLETRPLHEWMAGWSPTREIEEGKGSGAGQGAIEKTEVA